MTHTTDLPVFQAGSQVRDRLTGDVYTVASAATALFYTSVRIDPNDDSRSMSLPTRDLEAVADDSPSLVPSTVRPSGPSLAVAL